MIDYSEYFCFGFVKNFKEKNFKGASVRGKKYLAGPASVAGIVIFVMIDYNDLITSVLVL